MNVLLKKKAKSRLIKAVSWNGLNYNRIERWFCRSLTLKHGHTGKSPKEMKSFRCLYLSFVFLGVSKQFST